MAQRTEKKSKNYRPQDQEENIKRVSSTAAGEKEKRNDDDDHLQRERMDACLDGAGALGDHHHCYLLRSKDPKHPQTTYIGYTVNPFNRIRQHNGDIQGGAYRTKKSRPWTFVAVVHGFASQSRGCCFEWHWQHPYKSTHVRRAIGNVAALHLRRQYNIKSKLRVLKILLTHCTTALLLNNNDNNNNNNNDTNPRQESTSFPTPLTVYFFESKWYKVFQDIAMEAPLPSYISCQVIRDFDQMKFWNDRRSRPQRAPSHQKEIDAQSQANDGEHDDVCSVPVATRPCLLCHCPVGIHDKGNERDHIECTRCHNPMHMTCPEMFDEIKTCPLCDYPIALSMENHLYRKDYGYLSGSDVTEDDRHYDKETDRGGDEDSHHQHEYVEIIVKRNDSIDTMKAMKHEQQVKRRSCLYCGDEIIVVGKPNVSCHFISCVDCNGTSHLECVQNSLQRDGSGFCPSCSSPTIIPPQLPLPPPISRSTSSIPRRTVSSSSKSPNGMNRRRANKTSSQHQHHSMPTKSRSKSKSYVLSSTDESYKISPKMKPTTRAKQHTLMMDDVRDDSASNNTLASRYCIDPHDKVERVCVERAYSKRSLVEMATTTTTLSTSSSSSSLCNSTQGKNKETRLQPNEKCHVCSKLIAESKELSHCNFCSKSFHQSCLDLTVFEGSTSCLNCLQKKFGRRDGSSNIASTSKKSSRGVVIDLEQDDDDAGQKAKNRVRSRAQNINSGQRHKKSAKTTISGKSSKHAGIVKHSAHRQVVIDLCD